MVAVMLVVSEIGLVVIQRRLPTRGVDEALRQRIDNIKADIARGVFDTELPGVATAAPRWPRVRSRAPAWRSAAPRSTSLLVR